MTRSLTDPFPIYSRALALFVASVFVTIAIHRGNVWAPSIITASFAVGFGAVLITERRLPFALARFGQILIAAPLVPVIIMSDDHSRLFCAAVAACGGTFAAQVVAPPHVIMPPDVAATLSRQNALLGPRLHGAKVLFAWLNLGIAAAWVVGRFTRTSFSGIAWLPMTMCFSVAVLLALIAYGYTLQRRSRNQRGS